MRESKFGMNIHSVFADLMTDSMPLHSTLTLQICLQKKVYRMGDTERDLEIAGKGKYCTSML
jgi:hypothetical protein